MTAGPNASLYGTAEYGGSAGEGAVFQLTPPSVAGGAWTENVLYTFGQYVGDGEIPATGVGLANNGDLYGVTMYGGVGWGTLFQLTPPATPGGSWTETLPATFSFFNGAYPAGGLTAGPNGELYGTPQRGGAVVSQAAAMKDILAQVDALLALGDVRKTTTGACNRAGLERGRTVNDDEEPPVIGAFISRFPVKRIRAWDLEQHPGSIRKLKPLSWLMESTAYCLPRPAVTAPGTIA